MEREKVYGVCPHDCPDTCGFVTEVEDGRAVAFYGDKEHPITDGWLCAKVRPYLDHVYHPERLQYPLKRVGVKGGGEWERISWAEAIGMIGERWRGIIEQYGAAAILPFSYSGTLGVVQMWVASGRFWNRLGASQLERAICGAAAEYAVERMLGVRRTPDYQDVVHSEVVIIWGHNPVSTAPHFMPYLKKAQKGGTKVVVIDPRRTRTAKGADMHIAPLPGTDGALALGVGHILVREGWHDESWLEAHTVGWEAFKERLEQYPPERVAAITGVSVAEVEMLAEWYGKRRPGLIKIADGLQRNRQGGQTVRAICALPALTGQYGVLGGGLGYSASGSVAFDFEVINKWAACPPPGRVVNMNRLGAALLGEVSEPPIQSLFVFGANPAAVNPRAGRVVEGLKREDLFTVVHELFMTDTADYADLVLPATSQLEQVDFHRAYGHTVVAYNAAAIEPLGEAKSNWEVMRLLAAEMGFDEPWLQAEPDEIIDELLTATAVSEPRMGEITLERLKREKRIALPLVPRVPFADGHFPTETGRVMLYDEGLAAEGLDPLPGWVDERDDGDVDELAAWQEGMGLRLVTGAAHHFVTSSLANQASLRAREGEPFVEICVADAVARDIEDGEMVMVGNGRGWCKLRARVSDTVRAGVVASPKGYWAKHGAGRNINWTTSDALGDMGGQSTFHDNLVWVWPVRSAEGV
ncbi:MAG TPA: molybdopterin oxidoreductase family protein [Anaerolineae bacterium]|nr:molybdopterin oxidoreductase family protein [Anaerolineae bacterium]